MAQEEQQFFKTSISAFKCDICFTYLRKPVNPPCGHTFCKGCLNQWVFVQPTVNKTCPVCRSPFKEDDVKEAFFARKLLHNSFVECNFCDYKTELSNYESMNQHENDCKYVNIKITNTLNLRRIIA